MNWKFEFFSYKFDHNLQKEIIQSIILKYSTQMFTFGVKTFFLKSEEKS